MTRRKVAVCLAALWGAVLVLGAGAALAAGDVQSGTWKMNPAKSKYEGPAPKSATVKIESNPQEILERKEPITKVPFLIMQGALDDNMLPMYQEQFAKTYKAVGGSVQYELFQGCEHEWVAKEGPQTDRAPFPQTLPA